MQKMRITKKIIFWALIGYHILNNLKFKIKAKFRIFRTSSGSVLTESIDKASKRNEVILNKLIKYGGLTKNTLKGKKVLEIGPGDNLGVALKLISMGAVQVTCIDKFWKNRNLKKEMKLYKKMIREMSSEERKLAESALALKKGKIFNKNKIEYICGKGIEENAKIKGKGYYDIIFSNSVMEHVQDVDKAFKAMDHLLKKGGLMVHSIDFKDHGMFTAMGLDPLVFLTIPSWLWNMMRSHSGRPNRQLIRKYKDTMKKMKYKAEFSATEMYGPKIKKDLDKIRPKLAAEFRECNDNDILTSSIVLIAKK
jgi:SAM-dependent methyltransferase